MKAILVAGAMAAFIIFLQSAPTELLWLVGAFLIALLLMRKLVS